MHGFMQIYLGLWATARLWFCPDDSRIVWDMIAYTYTYNTLDYRIYPDCYRIVRYFLGLLSLGLYTIYYRVYHILRLMVKGLPFWKHLADDTRLLF